MPNGDMTGPMGAGPMTGRGAGQGMDKMATAKAALEQIVASEDINEIKQIAQDALGTMGAGEVEPEAPPEGLREKLSKVIQPGG